VPKRTDQRRRRNKENGDVTRARSTAPVGEGPEADPDWHPVAIEWFTSLGESGQSQFYEPSDWAQARYIAHEMSRSLEAPRFSGQALAAITGAMTELLTTEGARRRARLELEKGPEAVEDAGKVSRMDAYRQAAKGG